MLLATNAKKIAFKKVPAIIHYDMSVRPQIVNHIDCKLYHKLLNEFFKITRIPILLNTSFNVRGEPIVCKPDEALRCFISHGIDLLVIGNYVINKKDF